MFDIGWPELLVIAIVLIVVVGPKDLPRMLRTFGRTTSKLRSMAGDFRRQFDEALKEAELDEVKSVIDKARKMDPTADIRKQLNPINKIGEDIKGNLASAAKSPTAASNADAQKPAQESTPAAAKAANDGVKGNGQPVAEATGTKKPTGNASAGKGKAEKQT